MSWLFATFGTAVFLSTRNRNRATEKMFEIAQNMKQRGYDAATIADLTGLSLAEIERLN